jgi:hypothetical protein
VHHHVIYTYTRLHHLDYGFLGGAHKGKFHAPAAYQINQGTGSAHVLVLPHNKLQSYRRGPL